MKQWSFVIVLGTFFCLVIWNVLWLYFIGSSATIIDVDTLSSSSSSSQPYWTATSMPWTTHTPEVHSAQHQVEEEKFSGMNECNELMSALLHQNDVRSTTTAPAATTVNRLRRHLMIHHRRDCFQHHQDFFEDFFIRRTSSIKQHWILHVPKTAGTSLCALVRNSPQFTDAGDNCWIQPYFCPLWCCCKERRPLTSCNDLTSLPDVVMNENYWDHFSPAVGTNINHDENENEENCASHRISSITLRNPIDRAMSNVNHFRDRFLERPFSGRRLDMIQSNYLTWSLVAGLMEDSSGSSTTAINHHPNVKNNPNNKMNYFVPQTMQHVDAAKTTLAGMDFLLQFSRDIECDARILHFMGFDKTELGRFRNRHSTNNIPAPEYQQKFNRTEFEAMNQLDTKVYQYAMQIMKVDCEFFASIELKQQRKQ